VTNTRELPVQGWKRSSLHSKAVLQAGIHLTGPDGAIMGLGVLDLCKSGDVVICRQKISLMMVVGHEHLPSVLGWAFGVRVR
jgi:hypothetical protein